MITKEQAMGLPIGEVLFFDQAFNTDGTPQRWRVNGKCHTWKTRPDEFKVPLKHGLRSYGYLNNQTARNLHLTEEEAYEAVSALPEPEVFRAEEPGPAGFDAPPSFEEEAPFEESFPEPPMGFKKWQSFWLIPLSAGILIVAVPSLPTTHRNSV